MFTKPEIQSFVESASEASQKLPVVPLNLVRIAFVKITLIIIIENIKENDGFHLWIINVLAVSMD